MNYQDIRQARWDAEAVDEAVRDAVLLVAKRLRVAHKHTAEYREALWLLKRELQNFDLRTRAWRVES